MLSSSPVADVLAGSARFAVECARAEDLADRLPDKCANLLWLDIPYFKVKTDQAWDCAWPTADAFLTWLDERCQQWRRIMAPNGSLYVFASPDMAWHVEGVVRRHFEVLTNIRWLKPPHSTKAEMFVKEDLRSPFPASETILFCEQPALWPAMIESARKLSGLSRQDVSEAVVCTRSGACWNWEAGIRFPERAHWNKLRALLPTLPEFDEVERPFFATSERPYTDVWTYSVVQSYDGKHPCEKPYPMCEDALLLSSRPGDLVVDLFCGSGGIGAAAMAHDRRFIGGDMDPHWRDFTERRCAMTIATGKTSTRKVVQAHPAQMSLL